MRLAILVAVLVLILGALIVAGRSRETPTYEQVESAPTTGRRPVTAPRCEKGCPCGDSCIDCSKTCHK